jgi:hypothetical protein
MILDLQVFRLILYGMTTAGFFMTLRIAFCSLCMNMACPLNVVPSPVREAFFQKNPSVAEAWGRTVSG